MMRWFSVRRLIAWTVLASSILVTMVFFGRIVYRDKISSRKYSILASRKARLYMAKEDVKGGTAIKGNGITSDIKNVQEARILVLPKHSSPPPPINEKPFLIKTSKDMEDAYAEFVKSGETMDAYLWNTFYALALSSNIVDKDGKAVKPQVRFEKSIKRHVALFYGEYLIGGGSERRHFGLPVCRNIGLTAPASNDTADEYVTDDLKQLIGSQGTLTFKDIVYKFAERTLPFLQAHNGVVQLVTKYFKVNRKKKNKNKNSKDEHDERDEQTTPDNGEYNREPQKTREHEAMLKIFSREYYALETVNHKGVVQPICYEKQPRLKMVYPFYIGGDLVTLASDHFVYRLASSKDQKATLSPDQTFLPRFFRQLAEAVFAVHSAGILHLDLKPENFVIHGPDRKFIFPHDHPALQNYHLVLIDFGLSSTISMAEKKDCLHVGTEVTMAPEQVMCNHATSRGTDWWAAAAAMWRTRILWEPTLGEDERSKLLKSKCEQWGHYNFPDQPFFSDEFRQLMEMMLKPTPRERDFSKDKQAFDKLLDSPYLLLGLEPALRKKRLEELKDIEKTARDHHHHHSSMPVDSRSTGAYASEHEDNSNNYDYHDR